MMEIAIFPSEMPSAMMRLFISMVPTGVAELPMPCGEHFAVVVDEVRTGDQRHRRLQHVFGRQRRRDEDHIHRKRYDDHAQDQHDVGEGSPGMDGVRS
ncbi:hypothetical protein GCM10023067_60330 [Aminobacter aganoensis]